MKLVSRKQKRVSIRKTTPVTPNADRVALHALFQRISANSSLLILKRIAKKLRTTNINRYCVKLSELIQKAHSFENNNNIATSKDNEKALAKCVDKVKPNTFPTNKIRNSKMHENFLNIQKLSNKEHAQNLFEISESISPELIKQLRLSLKDNFYKNDLLNVEFKNIYVVVGKVLRDDEVVVLPKMNLICLSISESAKKQVEMFGGQVYSMDQLFDVVDDFDKLKLIEGDSSRRRVTKYYGGPGSEKRSLEKVISKKKDVLARPS